MSVEAAVNAFFPMQNPLQLYLFSMASLAILLIPGPAVLYVAVQSISQGRVAGIVAVLGLECGTVFHVVVAALSISALLPTSSLIFSILKCFGTAYLLYLGVHNLLHPEKIPCCRINSNISLRKVFWQGLFVEVLNPKTMLFFFAFLPQFVNSSQGDITCQVLILGFLFVGLATVIDVLYATIAASARHLLYGKRPFMRGQRYIESSVYVGLGIATALSSARG